MLKTISQQDMEFHCLLEKTGPDANSFSRGHTHFCGSRVYSIFVNRPLEVLRTMIGFSKMCEMATFILAL